MRFYDTHFVLFSYGFSDSLLFFVCVITLLWLFSTMQRSILLFLAWGTMIPSVPLTATITLTARFLSRASLIVRRAWLGTANDAYFVHFRQNTVSLFFPC